MSKVFIKIDGAEEKYFLFSRKRKENNKKANGRLELLGGQIDGNESALEALMRELKEEDTSLTLCNRTPLNQPREIKVGDEPHYIFEIEITWNDLSKLQHRREESFGFELVPIEVLNQDSFEVELTPKTKKILREYNQVIQNI